MSKVFPRRLWLNNGMDVKPASDVMQRSLPYCDIERGTKNRVVTRDPITGLGNIEYNPYDCNKSVGHINRVYTSPRDPIAGFGEYGDDSNKSTASKRQSQYKPPEHRNPILSGNCHDDDLDEERAGRCRHKVQLPVRDPINGTGDFGKFDGKGRRAKSAAGPGRNPITHERQDPDQSRSGKRITYGRAQRDPISGDGVQRRDTMDLWKVPDDYCFRSYLQPHNRNQEQSRPAPAPAPAPRPKPPPIERRRSSLKKPAPKEEQKSITSESPAAKPEPIRRRSSAKPTRKSVDIPAPSDIQLPQATDNGDAEVAANSTSIELQAYTEEPVVADPEPDVVSSEPDVVSSEPNVASCEPDVVSSEPDIVSSEPYVVSSEPEPQSSSPAPQTEAPDSMVVHDDPAPDTAHEGAVDEEESF